MNDWAALLVGILGASAFWLTVGAWAWWKAFRLLSAQHATDAMAELSRHVLDYLDTNPERGRKFLEHAAEMDQNSSAIAWRSLRTKPVAKCSECGRPDKEPDA